MWQNALDNFISHVACGRNTHGSQVFNSNLADLMSFAVEAVKIDHVAPFYGNRHLKNFFAELAIAPE